MSGVYEVQITNEIGPGDKVEGLFLRPDKIRTLGVVDPVSGDHSIGIIITPHAGDPEFPEPVTLLLPFEKLEYFVKLLRTAEALASKADGGSA